MSSQTVDPPLSPPAPMPEPTPPPRLRGAYSLTVTTSFHPSATLPTSTTPLLPDTSTRSIPLTIEIDTNPQVQALPPGNASSPETLLEYFTLAGEIPTCQSLRRSMRSADVLEQRIRDMLGVPEGFIMVLYIPRGEGAAGGRRITVLDVVLSLIKDLHGFVRLAGGGRVKRGAYERGWPRNARLFGKEAGEVEARVHVLGPPTVPVPVPEPVTVHRPQRQPVPNNWCHHHHQPQQSCPRPRDREMEPSYAAHVAVLLPPCQQHGRRSWTFVIDLPQPRLFVGELAQTIDDMIHEHATAAEDGGGVGYGRAMEAGGTLVLYWAGLELPREVAITEKMFVRDMAGRPEEWRVDLMGRLMVYT